jgi:hypothetical protein
MATIPAVVDAARLASERARELELAGQPIVTLERRFARLRSLESTRVCGASSPTARRRSISPK